MAKIDELLSEYGESHQDASNKRIHWICVPLIMFSLLGLLYSIPFPGGRTLWLNWAAVLVYGALFYYLRLSIPLFVGFLPVIGLMLWGNHQLAAIAGSVSGHVWISLAIFAFAWVGQFIGHHIEGKKPSFLKDLQFLLIGPAWLLHFIYKKWGISYS
jgi:uncharacterized membrane protein YGL010W